MATVTCSTPEGIETATTINARAAADRARLCSTPEGIETATTKKEVTP